MIAPDRTDHVEADGNGQRDAQALALYIGMRKVAVT